MTDSHSLPERRGQPTAVGQASVPVSGFTRWLSGWRAIVVLLAAGGIGVGWYWLYQRQQPARQARSLYREAVETLREGSLEPAAQLLASAIARQPEMATAYLTLGEVQMQLGRLLEAVESYRHAARLKPKDATPFLRLGEALSACESFDAAEEALRRAAALAPRDPGPPRVLGHVRMLRQRWPEAAEAFRSALALSPRDAELHYDLGRAYREAGQTEPAAEAFRQALKYDRSHQPAQRALAELTGAALQRNPTER